MFGEALEAPVLERRRRSPQGGAPVLPVVSHDRQQIAPLDLAERHLRRPIAEVEGRDVPVTHPVLRRDEVRAPRLGRQGLIDHAVPLPLDPGHAPEPVRLGAHGLVEDDRLRRAEALPTALRDVHPRATAPQRRALVHRAAAEQHDAPVGHPAELGVAQVHAGLLQERHRAPWPARIPGDHPDAPVLSEGVALALPEGAQEPLPDLQKVGEGAVGCSVPDALDRAQAQSQGLLGGRGPRCVRGQAQGVEIGVGHAHAQPHHAPREPTEVRPRAPAHGAREVVADHLVAVLEGVARQRPTSLVLELDTHPAPGGGGEVQLQPPSVHHQRPAGPLAAVRGRPQGGETVEPHGIAPQLCGRLGVVLVDEQRHLRRAGLDQPEGREVRARGPVLEPDAGAQEGLAEGPVVGVAPASGHQHRVRAVGAVARVDAQRLGLVGGHDPPPGEEARPDRHVELGRAEVRAGLVRVDVRRRSVAEGHLDRLAPAHEVRRGRAADGAETRVALARPGPEVTRVAVLGLGPEGHVLGVELPGREDRTITEPLPAHAVGRHEGHEA